LRSHSRRRVSHSRGSWGHGAVFPLRVKSAVSLLRRGITAVLLSNAMVRLLRCRLQASHGRRFPRIRVCIPSSSTAWRRRMKHVGSVAPLLVLVSSSVARAAEVVALGASSTSGRGPGSTPHGVNPGQAYPSTRTKRPPANPERFVPVYGPSTCVPEPMAQQPRAIYCELSRQSGKQGPADRPYAESQLSPARGRAGIARADSPPSALPPTQ
jgi:hypothetical protein